MVVTIPRWCDSLWVDSQVPFGEPITSSTSSCTSCQVLERRRLVVEPCKSKTGGKCTGEWDWAEVCMSVWGRHTCYRGHKPAFSMQFFLVLGSSKLPQCLTQTQKLPQSNVGLCRFSNKCFCWRMSTQDLLFYHLADITLGKNCFFFSCFYISFCFLCLQFLKILYHFSLRSVIGFAFTFTTIL